MSEIDDLKLLLVQKFIDADIKTIDGIKVILVRAPSSGNWACTREHK